MIYTTVRSALSWELYTVNEANNQSNKDHKLRSCNIQYTLTHSCISVYEIDERQPDRCDMNNMAWPSIDHVYFAEDSMRLMFYKIQQQ